MKNAAIERRHALHHSLTCFLNSLFREWNGFRIEADEEQTGKRIRIVLNEDEDLFFPLAHESLLGRHRYTGQIQHRRGSKIRDLELSSLLPVLAPLLARDFDAAPASIERFGRRVEGSTRNIEQALKAAKDHLQRLYDLQLDFLASEQGLVIGHNFHPTPKSRDGFTDEDLHAYSPEFGSRFSLEWFLADPSILHQKTSHTFGGRPWTKELLSNEKIVLEGSAPDFVPVPMHPWQIQVLMRNPTIQDYVASKKLIRLGSGHPAWSATSSLRSIYRNDAPYMLKFSMSVKLTNSVRHLLAHEVERGLQLHDVLDTRKGREFTAKHPSFRILSEPAYLCFKDADGSPLADSIVVCRENPFQSEVAANKAVLATLTQDDPLASPDDEGKNLIQRMISSLARDSGDLSKKAHRWFQAYLDAALVPMMDAQANYGIALGAHQQNLILDLSNGFPSRAYFRDCQGTGYSELGFALFSNDVPLLDRGNGNVLNEAMGNWLFTYYAILNSTFNVITAIASSGWVTERDLLIDLKTRLEALRSEGVRDTSCLDYLLASPDLMHKGNFLCSFRDMNENTTSNPLAIYTPVANPLLGDTL